MIATLQKQHPHHSLMATAGGPAGAAAFLQHHRRNPSAPALTVHPTGTRGLLALAKPSPITKPSKMPSSKHQMHRLPPTNNAVAVAVVATPSLPLPPAETTDLLSTPPKEHRERGRKPRAANANANTTPMTPTTPPKASNTNNNNKRSASHNAGSSRRHQPDPEPSSTATPEKDAKEKEPQSQTSPRRRPAQHQRHNTAPPSPVVTMQRPPAGRGTRAGRRERHKSTPSADAPVAPTAQSAASADAAVLAPAAAITVPAPTTAASRNKKNAQAQGALSRSAPMEHSTPFAFPVGANNSHALSDWDLPAALNSPPRRPALSLSGGDDAWMREGGPRTAPIARSHHFPAYSPPATPTPAPAPVFSSSGHKRAPSQPLVATMFAFEDDDAVAIPSGTRSADVSPLRFARPSRMAAALEAAAAKKKQDDMWAASKFQTGPPLRDLPAPGL